MQSVTSLGLLVIHCGRRSIRNLSITLSLACSVALLMGLHISSATLLDGLLRPETTDDRGDEGVEKGLQEPLVDPQQHGDDDARDTNHDWSFGGQISGG